MMCSNRIDWRRCRGSGSRLFVVTMALTGAAGCLGPRTVQVQFYSPGGATVHVLGVDIAGSDIYSAGEAGHRLEYDPEMFAVYDLAPGAYDFAYEGLEGMEGAAIYGRLEVHRPTSRMARKLMEHSFIPIKLPSDEMEEGEALYPVRDLSYTAGLESREFDHLKQGDMITKVYFVADLGRAKYEYEEKIARALRALDHELAVLADRQTYLDNRYEEARSRALNRNPDVNIEDRLAYDRFDWWGVEEEYVELSKKRQALAEEKERALFKRQALEAERDRRSALLRSMEIINRAGALVLASPDLSLPDRDMLAQAAELGEVVAVVTVGGRHKYWVNRMASAAAGEPHGMDAAEE